MAKDESGQERPSAADRRQTEFLAKELEEAEAKRQRMVDHGRADVGPGVAKAVVVSVHPWTWHKPLH